MSTNVTVAQFQTHATDTGSVKVQIAQLSERISELTDHLKTHKKDFDSRSGLLKMVGRRRRLLNYLSNREEGGYKELIKALELRK